MYRSSFKNSSFIFFHRISDNNDRARSTGKVNKKRRPVRAAQKRSKMKSILFPAAAQLTRASFGRYSLEDIIGYLFTLQLVMHAVYNALEQCLCVGIHNIGIFDQLPDRFICFFKVKLGYKHGLVVGVGSCKKPLAAVA